MAHPPSLIIQVPRGSALARRLGERSPSGADGAEIVVETAATDADGNLESTTGGEAVLSVPSPEALVREAGEVRRVIAHAGTGTAPLVVVIEAADELRDDQLAPVLEASAHTARSVILRVIRGA